MKNPKPSSRPVQSPPEFAYSNKWEDLKAVCQNPDIILDCGAYVGQTAKNLRKAYPQATIYCFEPVASIYAVLCEQTSALDIHPVQMAVCNFNGSMEINLTASPQSNSLLGFLEKNNPLAEAHRVVGCETVEVCRLDDWARDSHIDIDRIDIIKLDVQGCEIKALQGAPKIMQCAKSLLVEVAFLPFYRECPVFAEVDLFVTTRGFRRQAIYASDFPKIWADALYVSSETSKLT